MTKYSAKIWLLVILGLALLLGASARLNTIKKMRRAHDFDPIDPHIDKETAARLQLPMVALFTFRSLAIDYLWIRADTLKNQGQYFDAMHLARLICKLQPNMPIVWDFQSWNMAYNLSVAMPNPPERWNWIEDAFKLLRDEGLAALPRSPEIYLSLGRIFGDKIGGTIDDHHRYYKQRLAYEMMDLLGPGVVSNQKLTAMAALPATWEELKADPNIATLATALKKAEPKFQNDPQLLAGLIRFAENPLDYHPNLHQVLADHEKNYALRRLQLFARTNVLRKVWKMEPRRMLEINKKYGPFDMDDNYTSENLVSYFVYRVLRYRYIGKPEQRAALEKRFGLADYPQRARRLELDWRLPFCHAIYWAEIGLPFAKERNVTWSNLNRLVYHNLQNMFNTGTLHILDPERPEWATRGQLDQEIFDRRVRDRVKVYTSQDYRMFPVTILANLDVAEEFSRVRTETTVGVESAAGYLFQSYVVNLKLAGNHRLSAAFYEILRQLFPENNEYQAPLENFVSAKLKEELTSIGYNKASQYIESLLQSSMLAYAVGNDELAAINKSRAQQISQHLLAEQGPLKADRLLLPEFGKILTLTMLNILNDETIDPDLKKLLLTRLQKEQPDQYNSFMDSLKKQTIIK